MDWRTGYLRQAQSDFDTLNLLRAEARKVPDCQCLHYLQMASEKLAKGYLTLPGAGPYPKTHDAFVQFLRVARTRRALRDACGFKRTDAFSSYMDSLLPLALRIESLYPEGDDHPNPEYPWEVVGVVYSPLDHPFAELDFNNPQLLKLLQFIQNCLRVAYSR